MSSTSNPYAPPKDEPFVPPPGPPTEEGVVTCTVVMTEQDMASGLMLTNKSGRLVMAFAGGIMGFTASSIANPAAQILVGAACAGLGWTFGPKLFAGGARRALANKSDSERTVSWRFSPDGYEITTAASYGRANWSTVHRFLEGPKCFVLYASEAMVHVIPKSALRGDDVNVLRGMFTSRIVPRKKPLTASGFRWVFFLWLLLILMFLAIWQFLQSDH
jgi:hypothetical protein